MTIYALSTAKGRAGIAVIRVSGPETSGTIKAICRKGLPLPRTARLDWFCGPLSGEKLDQGLVLWFPAPNSFTGEDVAEFHIHGGKAVVEGFLKALSKIEGLRPAEAGEFSRRAFDNGRLDLTEIEGLGDLIAADTEAQRQQALTQMSGGLGSLYEGWREELIEVRALVEAHIDFADEDLPASIMDGVDERVGALRDQMSGHLADGWRGERLREGVQIAILGAPNVGKSTLLNALARREVAIVSDIAGTTRDVVEVHLDLGGYAVTVADTAGLRQTEDEIEREGVKRAHARAGQADLKIVMADARQWPLIDPDVEQLIDEKSLIIVNKADLSGKAGMGITSSHPQKSCLGVWFVSAKTGQGFADFLQEMGDIVRKLLDRGDDAESPPMTRARHRRALQESQEHLNRYLAEHSDVVLMAENLRLAARFLGKITGRVDVEDVLDVIFSEFCIGK